MKKTILISLMLLVGGPAWAGGHEKGHDHDDDLINEQSCKEMKQGIGELLGIADYLWNEAEKATAVGREADEKVYEGIAFFSQQAANYSVIYEVWCD